MPSALFVTTVPITLEAFLAPFAERFRAQGWRVDGVANGASSDERIAESFDHLYDIGWSRNPLAPSNLLGTSAKVRKIADAGGYDIVHVHTPIAAFVSRFALRSMRSRPGGPVVIYTAHGFHFYAGGKAAANAVYRTMERRAAQWTDYLVTINREDFEAAKRLGGIAPERVRYIPGIGVDTARFSPTAVPAEEAAAVRRGLDIADSAFMLAMVAEFAPVKRHELVLQALAQVQNARVVLALVGDGPLESQLREKVVALRLAEKVRWAGYRRDLPALLAASNALVLASEREGLNRSALEAMASGCPVIGTDTRGITDAVGPDGGWIVGHNDADALAQAIDEAAANPEEVSRRGAAALDRARTQFALEKILADYDGLYREALAHRL